MDPFKPYQPRRTARLSGDEAEILALKAIAFIAADEELLPRFVALTGGGLEDLRLRVADRAFLGAVLDFILGDEATVLAFAQHEDIAPELPMLARAVLCPEGDGE